MKPIKISGAGPSGLAAAIVLSRAGCPVEVFEGRGHVGARFIGDFQVIENISAEEEVTETLQRYGISTNFFFKPVQKAIFFDYRLRPQKIQSAKPFGYFIRRGPQGATLDQGLLAQAIQAGVKVHYHQRIRQADIIATGPTSPDGLAKQMTFSTSLPDTVSVLFDTKRAPGGYAYLFVLDGAATFGCAITKDFNHINDYFDHSLKRFQEILPFAPQEATTGYSFMSFQLKASATRDASLFVGEAGGFQDYLFGLGLRYALTTGYLAAQSILEKKAYDPLWKSALGQAQEISVVNRFLYEWGGDRGLSAFIKRAGQGDVQTYLHRLHLPTLWKRLLLPFIKWAWQTRRRCVHPLLTHWCRKKTLPTSPPIQMEVS